MEAVRKLCADIQVPKLRDLGVSEEEFQSVVVQMARNGIASGTPSVNRRPVTEKEVVELFKLSF